MGRKATGTKTDVIREAALRAQANEAAAEEYSRKKIETEQADGKKREMRDQMIAQAYRMMGRIETADLFGKLATVSGLVWLKQLKESKVYLEIPGIGTWESYCDHLGKSRRVIDEQLQNLEIFGEELLAKFRQFSIGYMDLRKLRKAVTDGDLVVGVKEVKLGEEHIPMTPDHADDLQAAIEALLEEKNRRIEDADARNKAKDRVLEEKERVILNQERELQKLTQAMTRRELSAEEEVFLRQMAEIEVQFNGMLLRLEADRVPADATPLMRAAFMSLLYKMRAGCQAYFDTASGVLGIDTDDEWVPPYERDPIEVLTDGEFQSQNPFVYPKNGGRGPGLGQ